MGQPNPMAPFNLRVIESNEPPESVALFKASHFSGGRLKKLSSNHIIIYGILKLNSNKNGISFYDPRLLAHRADVCRTTLWHALNRLKQYDLIIEWGKVPHNLGPQKKGLWYFRLKI